MEQSRLIQGDHTPNARSVEVHIGFDVAFSGQTAKVRLVFRCEADIREEKDQKIISLGLHIVRNLLAIRDTVAEGTAIGEKEEFANLQVRHLRFVSLRMTMSSIG